MDYKKKYNKAQKWIESIYSELSHEQQMEAEAFFPELKESEDEKMMHQLHSWMKEFGGAEEYTEKVYTWLKSLLEKQGEPKETICDKCKKDRSFHSCQDITALGRCYIEGMNSSNNLESKFKVGDWVVYECGEDSATLQIKNIVYRTYEFTDDSTLNVVDEDTLRLWTIQDTKDGDVLASNRSIFIFSQEYIAGKPEAHCGIMNGLFLAKPEGCWTNEECYPATKEQRDALFAKMKEAGYEWDTEKKELKKISQRMVSAEAKEALYDKPVWSEEDETGWTNTMIMIKEVASNHYTKDSIKLVIDWLKSLKERYTWKPSDEQMEALHDLNLTGNISYAGQGQILIELYNNLKKLTE